MQLQAQRRLSTCIAKFVESSDITLPLYLVAASSKRQNDSIMHTTFVNYVVPLAGGIEATSRD